MSIVNAAIQESIESAKIAALPGIVSADAEIADGANDSAKAGRHGPTTDLRDASVGDAPKEGGFASLGLREEVLKAVINAGYERPSAIQEQTIPLVLGGNDLLGQAVTGSGKTAAFACPMLSMLDLSRLQPQALILTPTRELAIQVTEAIEGYASLLPGFRAVTLCGGQSYDPQMRALKRGVHVVVGTPGRVMDHMRRETLRLQNLGCLVLDEADEMLRMGFVDDVEWILTMTPADRQILLFSATLPPPIRRIAEHHLKNPEHITIGGRATTAESIRQRYVLTAQGDKNQTLTRILESEPTDGVIVFVRTRSQTVELADTLTGSGFSASALNGDMPQNQRERTVDNFRSGRLAVLVATDVAARGLDVNRVSHVINYDFPHDVESYVHRIGRTGRAGRAGNAILFLSKRERGRLNRIESGTKQRLEEMAQPSVADITAKRIADFKRKVVETAQSDDLEFYAGIAEQIERDGSLSPRQLAGALTKLAQGNKPLVMKQQAAAAQTQHGARSASRSGSHSESNRAGRFERGSNTPREHNHTTSRGERSSRGETTPRGRARADENMQAYRIEVGLSHGIGPKNIVGAIANESGIDSAHIGRISLYETHSTIDLPNDLSGDFFRALKNVRVGGQQIRLSLVSKGQARGDNQPRPKRNGKPPFPGGKAKTRTAKPNSRGPEGKTSDEKPPVGSTKPVARAEKRQARNAARPKPTAGSSGETGIKHDGTNALRKRKTSKPSTNAKPAKVKSKNRGKNKNKGAPKNNKRKSPAPHA